MKKVAKTAAPSAPPTTGNVFKDMVVFGRADTEVAQLVVDFAECISKKRLGVDAAASLVEIDAQDLANVLQGTTAGFPAERLRELIERFKEKTKRPAKPKPTSPAAP